MSKIGALRDLRSVAGVLRDTMAEYAARREELKILADELLREVDAAAIDMSC